MDSLSYRAALLAAVFSASVIALILAVFGIPWNAYWWFVLSFASLTLILVSFLYGQNIANKKRIVYSVVTIACVTTVFAVVIFVQRQLTPPVPVFTVSYEYPTRDKSQSKVWYADGLWWAWLPSGTQSTLWRREVGGVWREVTNVGERFDSIPGLADVWPENSFVAAVVHTSDLLTFATLHYDLSKKGYFLNQNLVQWTFQGGSEISNATLARDEAGIWFVSYVRDFKVWVVVSEDTKGISWFEPLVLADQVTKIDKSIVFPLQGGVGVMWGDQNNSIETVEVRIHQLEASHDDWLASEVLRTGKNVAEDHFNAALALDGSVYISTMDDRNVLGEALLIMWVRTPNGQWKSIPYADLTNEIKPTRAIVLLREKSDQFFIVHNNLIKGKNTYGEIVYRCGSHSNHTITSHFFPLIRRSGFDVRDPTSTKQRLSTENELLVLASDSSGRVYEARLAECGG